jgi:phospholipid/cholesterol/gamma-HCH transport system substrate-binding protein
MKRFSLEFAVGLFMIAGIVCLGYLSIKLGRMELGGKEGYSLVAMFSNSGGLKTGSSVVIAGVEVGRVKEVSLEDYQARVVMMLPESIQIQEDAIASVKTKGLIGEKYVEITAGGSDVLLEPGDRIRDTQPAVDLEQVISSFVFGKL